MHPHRGASPADADTVSRAPVDPAEDAERAIGSGDGRRPRWRAVAVPSEHGGWGLTLEPALLGLVVAPSMAGAALALGAVVAFLVRTPLKLVLVDRWRHRWLPRTRLASGVAAIELAVLIAVALAAGRWAGWGWLAPVAVAAPLVGTEMWFDMRSRGRRLVPELGGSIGIGAVATAIALAGGEDARLAVGLWLVVAARAVASIPFVRVQIDRLRHGHGSTALSDRAQLAGVALAAVAVVLDERLIAGAAAVAAVAGVQTFWLRRRPVAAKILGVRQMLLGFAVVAVTAAGVLALNG